MRAIWLPAIFGVFAVLYYLPEPSVRQPPGELVPEEPSQTPASADEWIYRGYRLTSKASFRIRARVLLKDPYWLGRESDLSPLDLTVGWGLMSDQRILEQFEIYRGHRCFWLQPETNYARQKSSEALRHVANIHLIPATAELEEQVKKTRRGNVVELSGKLVNVQGGDGWTWRTSLSRDDTGQGACELLWVEWARTR